MSTARNSSTPSRPKKVSRDNTQLRRGPKPILTPDTILDGALTLLNAEGPENMSIRRLAAHLNVSHMTIYGYFSSKEELFESMALKTLTVTSSEQSDRAEPWHQRMSNALKEIHESLVKRPGVAQLFVSHAFTGPKIDALRNRLMDILRPAGLTERQTSDALSILFNYLLGTVMIESTHRPRLGSSASFEFGLELLVSGLKDASDAAVKKRRAASRKRRN